MATLQSSRENTKQAWCWDATQQCVSFSPFQAMPKKCTLLCIMFYTHRVRIADALQEESVFRWLLACSSACEVTFTHPCNAPTARVNRCCTVLSVIIEVHTCLHTHTLSLYDLQYPAVSCVTSNDRSLSLSVSLRCLSWCYGSFPCDGQLDISPALLMHECVHFYVCAVSICISRNV